MGIGRDGNLAAFFGADFKKCFAAASGYAVFNFSAKLEAVLIDLQKLVKAFGSFDDCSEIHIKTASSQVPEYEYLFILKSFYVHIRKLGSGGSLCKCLSVNACDHVIHFSGDLLIEGCGSYGVADDIFVYVNVLSEKFSRKTDDVCLAAAEKGHSKPFLRPDRRCGGKILIVFEILILRPEHI